MNCKYLIIIAFTAFWGLSLAAYAQSDSLIIHFSDKSKKAYAVTDIQKITFNYLNKVEDKSEPNISSIMFYPNPSNKSVSFIIELNTVSQLTIDIFDLHGKKIRTIDNQLYQAGKNEIIWDRTDLEGNFVVAGIYLFEVRTTTGTFNGKIILI